MGKPADAILEQCIKDHIAMGHTQAEAEAMCSRMQGKACKPKKKRKKKT